MHHLPRGIRNALIKDSQAHKNLIADGLHPNYVEPYDMATQNQLDAAENDFIEQLWRRVCHE